MQNETRKQLRKYVTAFSDNLVEGTELALITNLLTQGTALIEQTPDGSFHKLDSTLELAEVHNLPYNSVTRNYTECGDILYTGVTGNIILEYNFTAKTLLLVVLEHSSGGSEDDSLDDIATFMHIDEPVGDFDEWFVTNFTPEGTAVKRFDTTKEEFNKYSERKTSLGLLYKVITEAQGSDWDFDSEEPNEVVVEEHEVGTDSAGESWHSDFYATPEDEALAMSQLARFKSTNTWDSAWDGFKPTPYKHVSTIPEGKSPQDKTTFQDEEVTYQEFDNFTRELGEALHIAEELLAYRQKHNLINEPTRKWVDDDFDWR